MLPTMIIVVFSLVD